jgi:outer membrane protein assembly factor BamB
MCLLWAHGAIAQNLGDPECETLWLVSSYSTNSIKAYDGCSGDYIQDIEDNGWLAGPQAIVDDGDGGLVVVSEENDRLIRFDRQTLAVDRVIAGDDPETGEVELSPFDAPTGLAISPDGRIFVGSFSQDRVLEIDSESGQAVSTIVAHDQGIEGADAGMWLQGDQLYVPGFDSSTIVRANINQASSGQTLVSAGSDGLNAPRTIIVDDQGDLLVSSWRSNQILAFDRNNGNFKRVVASVSRPTGMVLESPDVLLITSDQVNDVKRVRVSDGQVIDTPVASGSGGLRGGTWIKVSAIQSRWIQ